MANGINRLIKQEEKAGFAVQKYVRAFKQKNIHVWLKLFDTFIKPIILYACESWGNNIYGSLNNIDSIFNY